jgi:hypothetical protein
MKLSYRGSNYEPQHEKVETFEGEVGGHYRGLPWRVHRHKQQARHNSQHKLTYRGVPYQN